jgi:hypothetical protein
MQKNRPDSPDVGAVIRQRSTESANVLRIVLLRQNEANRRLHFVSVVKKMRQAWNDNEASRVGLDKYPHHPREQC